MKIDCPIILALLEAGVPVSIVKFQGRICFQVDGFYKSGSVTLVPQEDTPQERENRLWFRYLARARYEEATEIQDLHDLVALNSLWLHRWVERGNPLLVSQGWEKLLIEHGYLDKKETITPIYTLVSKG